MGSPQCTKRPLLHLSDHRPASPFGGAGFFVSAQTVPHASYAYAPRTSWHATTWQSVLLNSYYTGMLCLKCAYDLQGLPEPRCPECGQPFDPADATTFMIKQRSGKRYLAAAIVVASGMVLPLVLRLDDVWRVFVFLIPVFVVGGTFIQAGVAIRSFQGLFTEQRSRYSHRVALAAAFVISGACVMAVMGLAWMLVDLMRLGVFVVPKGF